MDKELLGYIKQWNDQKGFGFIKTSHSDDVFFHITSMRGDKRPDIGDKVWYIPKKNSDGRLVAEHIRSVELTVDDPSIRDKNKVNRANFNKEMSKPLAGDKKLINEKSRADRKNYTHASTNIKNVNIKIVAFFVLVTLPVWAACKFWILFSNPVLGAIYFMASLITFYSYWNDKQSAKKNERRTPEKFLHLLELSGGWIGALVAQQMFRHKTRKFTYQFTFWIIVLLHQAFWFDWLVLHSRYLGNYLPNFLLH